MQKAFIDTNRNSYAKKSTFKKTTVRTLLFSGEKINFIFILQKLWFQHVLPSLKTELQSPEVLAAALQPLLFMIEESTTEEYQNEILPVFRTVFSMPKSVQVSNLVIIFYSFIQWLLSLD